MREDNCRFLLLFQLRLQPGQLLFLQTALDVIHTRFRIEHNPIRVGRGYDLHVLSVDQRLCRFSLREDLVKRLADIVISHHEMNRDFRLGQRGDQMPEHGVIGLASTLKGGITGHQDRGRSRTHRHDLRNGLLQMPHRHRLRSVLAPAGSAVRAAPRSSDPRYARRDSNTTAIRVDPNRGVGEDPIRKNSARECGRAGENQQDQHGTTRHGEDLRKNETQMGSNDLRSVCGSGDPHTTMVRVYSHAHRRRLGTTCHLQAGPDT